MRMATLALDVEQIEVEQRIMALLVAERLEGWRYLRLFDTRRVREALGALGFSGLSIAPNVYKSDRWDMRVILHEATQDFYGDEVIVV